MMTDITLQEIDDAVKRDQFAAQVKRYAPLIAVGVILLLLAVASVQGWRYWQEKQQLHAAEALYQAQKAGSVDAFAAISKSAVGSYGAFAQLALAQQYIAAEKPADAIATLLTLAADTHADAAFRAIAHLQAAYLALEYTDPLPLVAAIEAEANKKDAVFPGLMKEWLALVAWKQGDLTKAISLCDSIAKDPATPQGLQQRAEQMAAVLTAQAPQYKEAKE